MATLDPIDAKEMSSGPLLLESGHTNRPDLISSVRQLVGSVTAGLKISPTSTNGIEEAMAKLESTDENFNSYELVRTLHDRVETAVGALVKVRVENRMQEGEEQGEGQETVSQISDEVINSKEYNQMLQWFLPELRSAVDEMLAEEKLLSHRLLDEDQYLLSSSRSSDTRYYNLDESETSGLSSFNQTGLMFMSQDQLQSIADALSYSQPREIRVEAMRHLLQFPPGDLVSCENWTSLKEMIGRALMDDDLEIANMSLKFHYRMFMARSAQTSLIVYLTLVDNLMGYFQSQEGGAAVTVSMGIDPADDRSIKLLARFRFLNHLQSELPSYWLRYSEAVMVEMIQATASLLSCSYSNPDMLGPVHYMALFDPKASWFRKWTHGQSSRCILTECLSRNPIIVQGLVTQVLKFSPAFTSNAGSSEASHVSIISGSDSSAEMGYYNSKMLQYVHFIQSLSMLERLLLSKKGRDLFPVKVPGRKGDVTINDLLLFLLNQMLTLSSLQPTVTPPSHSAMAPSPHHQQLGVDQEFYNPVSIITHVFEEIVAGNSLCQQLFCNMTLLSAMVAPLERFLDTSSTVAMVNEEMLILLGDLMAVLASNDYTRKLILHQPSSHQPSQQSSQQEKRKDTLQVMEVILHFTTLAMSSVSSHSPLVSPPVASAWLFVCRQLYKTGEGLLLMEQSDLHISVAKAWKTLQADLKSSREVSSSSGKKFLHGEVPYSLQDSLIDNLLDFAGTPKGVLLMQQTGLMAQCTQYMYKRYKLKLQVSKCEKFGYGCMVTQLASTVAGMLELYNCGFISMLVTELWGILEGGACDHRIVAPRAHPLDPMDRASHKAVINLLNVLSSFPALYEVFSKATPTSSPHSNPITVSDLFDRLVLVNTPHKRRVLLNFEEDHLFGLRVLSVLVTCLDSLLFLQTKYGFMEVLLSLQKDNEMEGGDKGNFVILDACSLERNRILVSCYCIGGSDERTLPPHSLTETMEACQWPLFTSYPVPAQYQPKLKDSVKESSSSTELYKLLTGPSAVQSTSPKDLRMAYRKELVKRTVLSSIELKLLLVKAVSFAVQDKEIALFSQSKETSHTSPAATEAPPKSHGMEMIVRYGQFLGVLDSASNHHKNLSDLLCKVRKMLSREQHPKKKTGMAYLDEDNPGFDWFTCCVFLLMRGSIHDSWKFLQPFSTLLHSAYMWSTRAHLSIHLPPKTVYSGIHPISAVTMHLVELILQAEVPHVSSAFRMSGYTPSQICHHWIRQCFLNFLNWSEVCNYLVYCVVMGTEYQVYFCVSVLKHLEPDILRHTQEQDLLVFLKEGAVTGFQTAKWCDFMGKLRAKFGRTVRKSLASFFR